MKKGDGSISSGAAKKEIKAASKQGGRDDSGKVRDPRGAVIGDFKGRQLRQPNENGC